ncbi:MAG: HipA domain-containing protein [Rhodothermales bacterium]
MQPVVAGRISHTTDGLQFNYGQSYLERAEAIPLSSRELPLREGLQPLLPGLLMPGCIRDASPDAWGRRVLLNKLAGKRGPDADPVSVGELTYLLESGSDRIGALDFQRSATEYTPRSGDTAKLDDLMEAADRIERGLPLPEGLDTALLHGSSIGGARPKSTLMDGETPFIAKFSSSSDHFPVVKAEFVAMRLAARAGLDVADVRLMQSAGRDVLLVKRFDRGPVPGGYHRRLMQSALTLLELDEMMARYASYERFADVIRHSFANPRATLHELFARLVFNILCGNTDDHARNHAAFWDGQTLRLTPAYDICPQLRSGGEATQAMLIHGENRFSRLDVCLDAARVFHLSHAEARGIVERQLEAIRAHWSEVADEACLATAERDFLWGRQFLNPYAFGK